MSVFIHESSYVDDGAVIGEGTKVWHFCHVMAGAVIGERCSLGQNVVVMPGTRIGNNVKIQNNVSIYEGVELGAWSSKTTCSAVRPWCLRT
jgi:UDP-2-acetamido-3-amino-2,3-dideoxy-glucuronate N-acetyltransferase